MKKKDIAHFKSSVSSIKGLVFIGDPHVWSKKPGRRRDKDFLETVLNKLGFAAKYANKNNLQAIILGDLLHDSTDNDLHMIARLTETLQLFENKPFVLVGNHDLREKTLTPNTLLHILHYTGQIHAIDKNGIVGFIDMEYKDKSGDICIKPILLGGTPYGEQVPDSLSQWLNKNYKDHDEIKEYFGVDDIFWLTHDDFAFDYLYPGAIHTKPILGVDYVINGHVHNTQKPLTRGKTYWYNPGNITRLTIDLIEQIPKIWVWKPQDKRKEAGSDGLQVPLIEGIEIPHVAGKDILSLEGTTSLIDDKTDEKKEKNIISSNFVEYIKEDKTLSRTDDGVFLKESIEEELEYCKAPRHISNIIYDLFNKSLEIKK